MKQKVQHLKNDYHFLLVGVCSAEEDYKFCWHLNRLFQFDFERVGDLEIVAQDARQQFAVFEFEDQDLELTYHLIANRNPAGLLIPEEKKADYILKISGEYQMLDLQDLMNKIRQIDPVIAVFPLEPKRLKSVDNLLF